MTEVMSYVCPFCGGEVRVGKPCPGCAKKVKKPAKKPWEQISAQDGLDLPDGDFDYEDFIAREFGKAPHRALGLKWYWWALAVLLLVVMVSGALWIA